MAAGDVTIFEEFTQQLGAEQHDFASDVIKLGLIDNTLTPLANIATPTWTDYSANEVSAAGGYVAGGLTLSSVTWTELAGIATLDADDIALVQNAGGFADAYWGILYNDTNGTDMAFAFVELAAPTSEVAGPVNINWNVSGIFRISIAA
ncbi:MAG: hypothetical protein AAGG44_13965 [Planctomycetota bacterium]